MKKCLCLLLVLLMLVGVTACGKDTDNGGGQKPNTSLSTTTGTDAPDAPVVPDTSHYNKITGLDDMNGSELTRPVGIMVANNDFIQDEQVGLAQADMWMEAETEGGITRMMAIFANTARVPESIGPVRSARSPFFHVVEALGLAYCHAGGSYPALNHIANSNIADLDVNDGSYSWRDNSYPHDYEYCLRTGSEELTDYMEAQGYNTTAVTEFPWTFGDNATTGEAAQTVSVTMSSIQTIGFEYDSADGIYYKTNGSLQSRHCDISGSPLTAKTVLVLYTDKFYENDETIDFYLQAGKGYVFADGVMRRFDWTRDDSGFTMTEEDGTQLTLSAGKVYMCVVATDYADGLSYSANL